MKLTDQKIIEPARKYSAVDLNLAASDVSGNSREELLNMAISDLIYKEDQGISPKSAKDLDNKDFTNSISAFLKIDGNKYMGWGQDIIERKQNIKLWIKLC